MKVDAGVLFAGATSSSDRSASTVVLRLSDLTLVAEAERNLSKKVPAAVPRFRELAAASLRVVPDPMADDVLALDGSADPKDLSILAAAARERSDVPVTSNEKDYRPGHAGVQVMTPSVLVQRVRRLATWVSGD